MEFPQLLSKLHAIEINYDVDEIDYEPYDNFLPLNEATEWFKAWTGNAEVTADDYLIFGQDGTGGLTAFWLVKDTEDLLEQPIIFFGSEGKVGVVAKNFYDFVWLFAQGYGPYEAVSYPSEEINLIPQFYKFAKEHLSGKESTPAEILSFVNNEFPGFTAEIEALCR
jgi:hypothetical protein